METRQLGFTDLHLSTIGLGAWAMGGGGYVFGWGPQDDAESIATIHRALDEGINWIDTAPGYGRGHSEEVVGKALVGRRHQVYIATKCGIHVLPNGELTFRLKRDSVRQEIEDSLRRLRTDVIDLYQIHWPRPDEDIEEAWEVIADAVRAGKIRYAGVSNFNISQMERLQAIHPIASLQPPYSMLNRDIESEILPYCAAHKIGVIVYSPMERGLLTGKITRERIQAMPEDDHRKRYAPFQEPQLSVNLRLVEQLRPIAERNGKTLAQLALAWVLRRPEVTGAIAGARRPDQVSELVGASGWQLSDADLKEIEALLAQRQETLAEMAH
ncbi:MAG: aldo/keto reductase [Anaerolineae bacterium]|nr:aldo/keto reductase [Anaerolineae bacterium]MDW8069866.1 aldo/keto reductase [Anaerolineae bacterium]